jgi:integrase
MDELRDPAPEDYLVPVEKVEALKRLVQGAWATNTERAYVRAWKIYEDWCEQVRRAALPTTPASVALFLEERGPNLSIPTLSHVLAAIRWAHDLSGRASPTSSPFVKKIWVGMRRKKGVAPRNAKEPITAAELRALLAQVDRMTLIGKRDAALLLVGFICALRRSELVAIDVEHIRDAPSGLSMTIPKSKTDQLGEGHVVGVPAFSRDPGLCPVTALRQWLAAAGIRNGPVFVAVDGGLARGRRLSPAAVAAVVKKAAASAGFDPKRYAGHSLRAGFVTEAYRQGKPEAAIMATTRHKSTAMLARYRREADPVARGAAGTLDLSTPRLPATWH